MRARTLAFALAVAMLGAAQAPPGAAPGATPAASPSPTPVATATPVPSPSATVDDSVPDLYVRGQILTVGSGFLVFTSGDALRLRAGTVVPKHLKTGSAVRATVDQLSRDVKAIELDPKMNLAGEIDVASLGRQYVVVNPSSAPSPAAPGAVAADSGALVSVTLNVTVPPNTPQTDDVYLSTDRSNFGVAEVRMQRQDARHFSVEISAASGTKLRYQYTRGYITTVERDKIGGIAEPRELSITAGAKSDDTVARWADLN